MLNLVRVMGDYWHEDRDEVSALGELVAAAKDLSSVRALDEIQRRLVEFVLENDFAATPLVMAVPPGPHREAHPVPAFAATVAAALGVDLADVMTRQNPTARLRYTPLEARQSVVEAAGYTVTGDVSGRSVVLVDDVILTGTTLRHLAALLSAAGAVDVSAVVVCRTRRSSGPRTAGPATP